MQCSGCGYISFKKEKDCGACGFKFKKSTQGSQSLAGKESFTIFAKSVKGQSEDNSAIESVGLLDEQETTSFIDPETGNFNLDLPATSEEIIAIDETASVEPVLEIGEPDQEPPLSIEPPLEISEPEKTISFEPALEIGEPEETPSIEPVLEIGELENEEATPALDLGENEIALDLDDNPSITPAPPVAAAPLDEVELSLEIDDSDDPLTIQSQDIPDLEIEDLGLELESSDDPKPDKP